MEYARFIGIMPIFLPPYSPDLNPIEFVWKTIKRTVSKNRIIDRDHMTSRLKERFMQKALKCSYFAYWMAFFNKALFKIVR